GDIVFFYHSVTDKQVVGIATVVKEFYPDATAEEGDWSCVDIAPKKALVKAISLEEIKADKILGEMPLVKQSRLSVTPLTTTQAERLLALATTKLPLVDVDTGSIGL
ncbi:MAG: EVE domain-containing protein, partial [Verrucomicrobia bacterium]